MGGGRQRHLQDQQHRRADHHLGLRRQGQANSATTYRSTNNGASWTAVSGLAVNNARPVADPVNPNKFYLYDNGKLLASTDGGASFVLKGTLPGGGSNVIRLAPGREGESGSAWAAA